MPAGLLLIHVVAGAVLLAHGILSKLRNLDFQAGYMASLGLRPGRAMALLSGLTEALAGAGLLAGFATPFAAAAGVAVMLVAARTDHRGKGFWIYNGGAEYVLVLGTVLVGLAFNGAGRWSVDHAIGWNLAGTWWGVGAAVAGLAGAATVLTAARLGSRRAVTRAAVTA